MTGSRGREHSSTGPALCPTLSPDKQLPRSEESLFTKGLPQLTDAWHCWDIVIEHLRKAEGRVFSGVFKNARLLSIG